MVILFGPVVSQIVWAIWMFAVVGGVLVVFFRVPIGPVEALRALGVILVAVPALYGLGALFAAVVLRFGEVSAMVQTVRGVFTVFCGMTFPIIILPVWAKAVALSLPPTYLIGDLRARAAQGQRLRLARSRAGDPGRRWASRCAASRSSPSGAPSASPDRAAAWRSTEMGPDR